MANEIDDIFSGKPVGKRKREEDETGEPSTKYDSTLTGSKSDSKKKKKKRKEKNSDVSDSKSMPTPVSKDGKKEVVVVDASKPSPAAFSKKLSKSSRKKLNPTKPAEPDSEDEFRDSRGTGPRRKTEEGYLVYKEDELGIGDEGGDTPLCPFDCDCCF